MLKELAHGLTHLVYPRLCEGCSKTLLAEEEVLCLNCNVYYLPRTAYHHIADNETAMRFTGRVPVVRATSFAYFTAEGLLQHLLHGLKYDGKEYVGHYLGKQLGYDLQQLNWASGIDYVIPIPLHKDKQNLRGYNQTELIANGISEVLHIPVDTETLYRIRNTESQTQKSREERIRNMQDAFGIHSSQKLQGKHILLIDDVLTTGATLESAAQALYTIPQLRISIATIGVAS